MTDELKVQIGKRVRQARLQKGLTKEALCEDESQLSVRQLTRVETGKSLLSIDKGLYIARRLGVYLQELIDPSQNRLPKSYLSLKRQIIRYKSYEDSERLKVLHGLMTELHTYYDVVPEEEQLAIDIIQADLDVFETHQTVFAEPLIEEYFEQVLRKESYTWNDYLLISLYLFLCAVGIEDNRYFEHFVPSIFLKGDLSDPDIAYQMEEIVLAVLAQEKVDYYPVCIETLEAIIKETKHFQNKPILDMFKAKLALYQGDLKKAAGYYQSAILVAESFGDRVLVERLQREYDKDVKML